MSKNSALNRPRVTESLHRSAKDLYRELNFNQSAGMIIPVMCQYVPKGTKGRLNRQCFTRTAQVVSPAFDRVTQHIDFFKIPLRLLYSPFNDWSLNIQDVNSSLLLGHANNPMALPVNLPYVDFSGILEKVFDPSVFAGWTPSQLANQYNESSRLIDALNYGSECVLSTGANTMSLLPLAAYQKVYYDHYRNTAYENNNAYYYNLDWCMDGIDLTDTEHIDRLGGIFSLRYVNYRNDYFHNIYPHLNYVNTAVNGMEWKIPSNFVGAANGADIGLIRSESSFPGRPTIQSPVGSTGSAAFVSVQAMRSAFALDKLLRASAYAPKHVKEQMKARFGVDPGAAVSYESERICSFVNNVVFGEVTATATTGTGSNTSTLGQIGGKGVGSGNPTEDFDFFCSEDSIVLGVQYFMPKGFYDSTGVDDFNTWLTREDFPQPEYMNLGLRPVYQYSLYNSGVQNVRNNILGYTIPYAGTKLGIDKNYGLFSRRFHYYTVGSQGNPPQSAITTGALSTFATHVSSLEASTLQGAVSLSASSFKVSPSDMDDVFKTSYPVTGSPIYDQFFGWLSIKLSIINWLSVHGQPSL